jgi:phenylalanyl-tRNA synthetase beta chain
MLCSARELGLSEDHSGILVLPPDTVIGTRLTEIFPDSIDTLIEIDNKSITHRPDLWGHFGFALEIAALFNRTLIDPVVSSLKNECTGPASLKVDIQCPDNCYRYCGLVVDGITVAESPEWLKARVRAIGMRPINNIVDITNYVMTALGEPMHAFDRAKLAGDNIIVRLAAQGEKLTTLDGQERELSAEDCVIADKSGAIALAGVMGGAHSEIDETTSTLVLEAACFNPVTIRKTAHRQSLRSEAAIRFEKSLDAEICQRAILRCYQLIREVCPQAKAVSALADNYPAPRPRLEVKTDFAYITRKIGIDIPADRILGIMSGLGFTVKKSGEGLLDIEVPSFRATKDIEAAIDIVEEVGRVYGYDNIPHNPPFVPCSPPQKNQKRAFERKTREILCRECGFSEVYNYSFVGAQQLDRLAINNDRELRLRNPLSSEHDRLRRSLLPHILDNVSLNCKHFDSFSLFELGRVYLKENRAAAELARENTRIAEQCMHTTRRVSLSTRQNVLSERCLTGLVLIIIPANRCLHRKRCLCTRRVPWSSHMIQRLSAMSLTCTRQHT